MNNSPLKFDGDAERKQSIYLKQCALQTIQAFADKMDLFGAEAEDKVKNRYWYRLAIRSSLPDTPLNELIRRSAFMLMSSLTCLAGLIWGLMYTYLDEPNAAMYPYTYSVLMTTCFILLTKEGRYHDIVFVQLALILVLPICLQFEVGGIVKAGGVVIWCFLCPLGAALFCSPSTAKTWFLVYILCMIVTISAESWEPRMNANNALSILEITMFTMNICGAMTITFFGALTFSVRLDIEYNRSEKLLHNVLPRSIAQRLKEGESHIIDHFDGVSILFADLVGFTKAAAEFHPNFLIGMFLRDVFSSWDQVCARHSMEKIKTIGDAFMAVGGIEKEGGRSGAQTATDMILLGFEMQKGLDEINKRYQMKFKCRIGLHSGPVIAGVIGVRKFAFDVWGDAVNTASRMESHGIPGYLHLTAETYEKVKNKLSHLDFKCRGEMEIKGKGIMTTYLIEIPQDKEIADNPDNSDTISVATSVTASTINLT
jgi:adenylate cyclase